MNIFKIKLLIKSFYFAISKLKNPLSYFLSIILDNSGILKFKNGLKLKYDGAGSIGFIFAIIQQNIYGNYFKNHIVIDIGANRGYFSIFAIAQGAKKVYAFEAAQKTSYILSENKDLNNINEKLQIHPIAVTSSDQKDMKLYSGTNKEDDSLYNLDKTNNYTLINTVSLNVIFNTIIEDDIIDLLKLNCEGAEYDILLNSPIHLFTRIKRIRLEFHNYIHESKEYHISMIDNHLKNNNFQIEKQTNIQLKHGIVWYKNKSLA